MFRNLQIIATFGLLTGFAIAQPSPVQPVQPAQPVPPVMDMRAFSMGSLGKGSYLGLNVKEIDANRAKELKLREENGVEITQVEDDAPAGKAGLKVGDVVVEFNGQRVEGTEQFVRMVRETPVGRQVKLGVNRQGTAMTMSATIAQRSSKFTGMTAPAARKLAEDMKREGEKMRDEMMMNMPRAYMGWSNGQLGVEAESLSDQLASYFGVKEGVLVRSVKKSSAAEKAGLKAGDVIVKVDSTKVATPKEIATQLRASRSKKVIPVQLLRDHKEMSIDVTLPEDEQGRNGTYKSKTVLNGNPGNKDDGVNE